MPQLPKNIFVYWASGFENAPEIVDLCVSSWETRNPDFAVIKIDDETVSEWVDLDRYISPADRASLTIQKFSDLIRLALLAEHGGFWVDSTTYCRAPINSWLDSKRDWSFFALVTPGQNRFIQSYFLGSTPSGVFLKGWLDEYSNFLRKGYQPMPGTRKKRLWKRYKFFSETKIGTVFWTLPFAVRRYGYPYLIMHYLANKLILSKPRFAWEFFRMPKVAPAEALRYQKDGRTEDFRRDFQSSQWPVWKMTWRTSVSPSFWNAAVELIRDDLRTVTET